MSQDCRQPVLKASAPVGFLGHESAFVVCLFHERRASRSGEDWVGIQCDAWSPLLAQLVPDSANCAGVDAAFTPVFPENVCMWDAPGRPGNRIGSSGADFTAVHWVTQSTRSG